MDDVIDVMSFLVRPQVASAGRDGKAAEGVAGAGGVGVAAAPRVYVENKYRPVFTRCASASLEEAKPPGTVVTEVRATDDDEVGPAGSVFYTILRAGSDKEFDVDSTTGVIRSSKVPSSGRILLSLSWRLFLGSLVFSFLILLFCVHTGLTPSVSQCLSESLSKSLSRFLNVS